MKPTSKSRHEFGDFLAARRRSLTRAELGLPVSTQSRSRAVRREDIASLSGVSVTWYTWLEQGREVNPSRQVVDAIARTLKLTAAERKYVLTLTDHAVEIDVGESAPASVRRFLDDLTDRPAYVVDMDWNISAWNIAYEAFYPHIATVSADERNLLWLSFTDPYIQQLVPDWQSASRRFIAEFRADLGSRVGDHSITALVERLRSASGHFATAWDSHQIEQFNSRERVFLHPRVGELRLEQHRLVPSEHPDLQVTVYTPMTSTGDTPARLDEMIVTYRAENPRGPGR